MRAIAVRMRGRSHAPARRKRSGNNCNHRQHGKVSNAASSLHTASLHDAQEGEKIPKIATTPDEKRSFRTHVVVTELPAAHGVAIEKAHFNRCK